MTVARAAELIRNARRGLALTGAGVSAESGIPTFRSADRAMRMMNFFVEERRRRAAREQPVWVDEFALPGV